uniref:Nuclear Testis protein N-terminal domain-containing protein n=1 Tax=Leptobrachium leishanense TaxID=445787 RepID=A0A8C5M3X8_9ANUR
MAQLPDGAQLKAFYNSTIPIIQPSLALADNSLQPVKFAPPQTSLHLADLLINRPMFPMVGNHQPGVFLVPVNQTGGFNVTPNLPSANATVNTLQPLYPVHLSRPGLRLPPPKMTHGSQQNIQTTDQNKISNCCSTDMSFQVKYKLWCQYKALLRKYNFTIVEIDVFACFLIQAMQTLSQQFPMKRFTEYISLAVQQWTTANGHDRRMFFRNAKNFNEFEITNQMMTVTTTGPRSEDMGMRTAKKFKEFEMGNQMITVTTTGPQSEDIEITYKTSQKKRRMEWRQRLDEMEKQQERSNHDITYLNSLCADEQFMSQVESIIDPDYIRMNFSRNDTIDVETFITKMEKRKYISETAADRSKDAETTSEPTQKKRRLKHCRRGAPSEIPENAIDEYCAIMDDLGIEHHEELKEDPFDHDMVTYVNTLCEDPQFMSEVDRMIDFDFVHMILSPNSTMDCERYITMQEKN